MKMVVNEMKKNLTKYISCLLLILMLFSIINPTNIFVLADEDKESKESQTIGDLADTNNENISLLLDDDTNLETYSRKSNKVETLVGWQKENGQWFYYVSGIAQTDWQKIGSIDTILIAVVLCKQAGLNKKANGIIFTLMARWLQAG